LTSDLAARFVAELTGCLDGLPAVKKFGVAVSGGGDSTALLIFMTDYAKANGHEIEVATVDHGLRPAAATEARSVAALCARLGIRHQTLCWANWSGKGNLQAAARAARYQLLRDWASDRHLTAVALGHTQDDQAETFLMRLARGSGVDGLSAMAPRRMFAGGGGAWLRPLLRFSRDELREFLRSRGVSWIDDPSNDDTRFARVKMRRALVAFREVGITPRRLATTAEGLRVARGALEIQAQAAIRSAAIVTPAGCVKINRHEFQAMPDEIQRRVFAHAIVWVSHSQFRPRLGALISARDTALGGGRTTLNGTMVIGTKNTVMICREVGAIRDATSPVDQVWDGVWVADGPAPNDPGLNIACLGENGIAQCPDWRQSGEHRATLLASPAIWRQGTLIAAPFAAVANGWTCRHAPGWQDFVDAILSH